MENNKLDIKYCLISWLTESGIIYEVKNKSHKEFAYDFLKKNSKQNSINNSDECVDLLYKKGWMRILYIEKIIYAENPFCNPNYKQISELKNMAIENEMLKVIYENNKSNIVVWEKYN